jgi:hypothetical protein
LSTCGCCKWAKSPLATEEVTTKRPWCPSSSARQDCHQLFNAIWGESPHTQNQTFRARKDNTWYAIHSATCSVTVRQYVKRWDPKLLSEIKSESRMLKVHVSFQMSLLKIDLWWAFRISICIPITVFWVSRFRE